MTDDKPTTVKVIRPAIVLFGIFWLLCGIVYPLSVYAAGQILFPKEAQGSLIFDNQGIPTGSNLIGQPFSSDKYFSPRPSMTADYPYNPLASAGSNLGPTSRGLVDDILIRAERLGEREGVTQAPSDLVSASASGLDPHISVGSARLQAPRVAKTRGISTEKVDGLIGEYTEKPLLGILGEERVNVLLLNRALDKMRQP
jgi:potassium-transporting ATPase KdpC subunit